MDDPLPSNKQQVCACHRRRPRHRQVVFRRDVNVFFVRVVGGSRRRCGADNSFLITPFIGKLVAFIDEVRLETAGVINEIKKLVRQKRISGQVKLAINAEYHISRGLILAANEAKIGLNPQDAADRALFFIMAWTAENKGMKDVRVQSWAWDQKPFLR